MNYHYQIACTLTESGLTALAGYCLNGIPYAVFTASDTSVTSLESDEDAERLGDALRDIVSRIQRELKVAPDGMMFVLPPRGAIYQVGDGQTTLSEGRLTTRAGTTAVKKFVNDGRKQGLFVSVYPVGFSLDGGAPTSVFPMDAAAETLTMTVQVSTLDPTLHDLWERAARAAGFGGQYALSSLCTARLCRTDSRIGGKFAVLEIGQSTSYLSLCSDGLPLRTTPIEMGVDTAVRGAASELGVPYERAREMAEVFGLTPVRHPGYRLPDGLVQDDYLRALSRGFKPLAEDLKEVLEPYYRRGIVSLVMVSVEGMYIPSLDSYLTRESGIPIAPVTPSAAGARSPGYAPLLGALLLMDDMSWMKRDRGSKPSVVRTGTDLRAIDDGATSGGRGDER